MFTRRGFFIIFLFFCFTPIKAGGDKFSHEYIRKMLDSFFSKLKDNHILNTDNNRTFVFNNGLKLFEIESTNGIMEKDFSINAPKGVYIKVFNSKAEEIININCEQFYHYKNYNTLLFMGKVEVNLIEYKTKVVTDCLFYDFDSDIFFNIHNTKFIIKEDTVIDGVDIYLKRDLSYLKILSPNIENNGTN